MLQFSIDSCKLAKVLILFVDAASFCPEIGIVTIQFDAPSEEMYAFGAGPQFVKYLQPSQALATLTHLKATFDFFENFKNNT